MHRPSTNDRLYLAVRADLPPGLAAAQAVHAALQFAEQHPDLTGPWMQDSKYLIIVAVPDEIELIGLASRALAEGLAVETWAEEDLGGQKTAIALQPGPAAQRLCANYPLHGRPWRLAV